MNVEKEWALLVLSREARGADSTKGKQRHDEKYHNCDGFACNGHECMSAVVKAMEKVSASFDRFCLTVGIETLSAMMEKDSAEVCGTRHSRAGERRGHR